MAIISSLRKLFRKLQLPVHQTHLNARLCDMENKNPSLRTLETRLHPRYESIIDRVGVDFETNKPVYRQRRDLVAAAISAELLESYINGIREAYNPGYGSRVQYPHPTDNDSAEMKQLLQTLLCRRGEYEEEI